MLSHDCSIFTSFTTSFLPVLIPATGSHKHKGYKECGALSRFIVCVRKKLRWCNPPQLIGNTKICHQVSFHLFAMLSEMARVRACGNTEYYLKNKFAHCHQVVKIKSTILTQYNLQFTIYLTHYLIQAVTYSKYDIYFSVRNNKKLPKIFEACPLEVLKHRIVIF